MSNDEGMTKRTITLSFRSFDLPSCFVIILHPLPPTFRKSRDAIGPSFSIFFCMNPNENDFTRDEPLPAQQFQPQENIGPTGREQFRRAKEEVSTQISQTW